MKIERDVTGIIDMVCRVCFQLIGPEETACIVDHELDERGVGAGWVPQKIFTHERCIDDYRLRLVRARLTGSWSTQPDPPDAGTFDITTKKMRLPPGWTTKPP